LTRFPIVESIMIDKKPLKIGLLGFVGVMALDLVGPVDAFSSAFLEDSGSERANYYELIVIGLTSRPFISENGIIR
jgi:hypothetical protein